MDAKSLNKDLLEIISKKNALSKLDYSDESYDDIEEELHDLEDDFLENYGEDFETVLEEVHGKIKSDNDILLPIAYVANSYKVTGKNPDGTEIYEVDPSEGVSIEIEGSKGMLECRLVILPSPVRIALLTSKDKKVLWQA